MAVIRSSGRVAYRLERISCAASAIDFFVQRRGPGAQQSVTILGNSGSMEQFPLGLIPGGLCDAIGRRIALPEQQEHVPRRLADALARITSSKRELSGHSYSEST
jgi:hypothetical protein